MVWLFPLCFDLSVWQPCVSSRNTEWHHSMSSSFWLLHARTRARTRVCVDTCVCEPDRVMWEEIVSLPYLGKASTPGDKASFHKA